jgi:two-component system, NarL family, invasion response regulator UvrY
MNPISIAFVDDHRLLRHGLVELVQKKPAYQVVMEADNGKDFINQLKGLSQLPDLVFLDIKMPEMNGFDTALWLKINHPKIKVIALSMNDDEVSIVRMIRNGAKGYLLKDSESEEFYEAIERVMTMGFYYSDMVVGALSNSMHSPQGMLMHSSDLISARELEFLKLICSGDITYKEIADRMNLSVRTIDGYRESLFEKLNVKSKVGLVLYAVQNNLLDN